MFELLYKVVKSKDDDFIGENGSFKLIVNEYNYGEIYSDELDDIMEKDSIYDWMERLCRVIKELDVNKKVYLSDVESYNTWLEFEIVDNSIFINEIKAPKENGSKYLELYLDNIYEKKWNNPKVEYKDFRNEIIVKLKEYRNFIVRNNRDNVLLEDLVEKLKV